jgi:uncharacterized membrane protein
VIAFVGTSLAGFFAIFVYYSYESFWVLLNREFLAEELVESIAVASGLVLSVPIVTVMAAMYVRGGFKSFIPHFSSKNDKK